ncbi:hypothetical protein [Aliterella atlantica]|uniref:hypothetical protein n=1 Tax=Aliterella atlantica TaxID=1827278 RepID=UPI001364C9CE|nr:hypothetical protein [Aliterella atlantica]
MPETTFLKQKSLEELKFFLKHYQQVYPKAKLQGQAVLRQYFRRANYRIQHLQFRSQGK